MRGPESREQEPRELPGLLDVVRLDGRWAQVVATGEHDTMVCFLDDQTYDHVDWDNYILDQRINRSLGSLEDISGVTMPASERASLHFAEHNTPVTDEDRGMIRVFGEYTKRASD